MKQLSITPEELAQLRAAKSTLEYMGYTWNGGQFWKPPLGKPTAYITMVQGQQEAVDGKMYVVWNIAMPAELHQDSQQLVHETATAMAEKLARAQVKYGFDNGWKVPPSSASGDDGRHFWSREECLTAFYHHLGKGDPLDCINYLAFMRANGWATQLPARQEQQPAAEIITAGIGGYGCDALVAGLPIGTKLYSSPPQPALPALDRQEAEHVASVLELIGSFDVDDIDGDSVDLRFELDGVDTGAEASMTGYAARGAAVIHQLLNQAPVKQPSSNGKSDLLQPAEKLAADVAVLVKRVGGSACEWSYDDGDHKWDGQCGAAWTFHEDGPTENGMSFCPGCGRPVIIHTPEEH